MRIKHVATGRYISLSNFGLSDYQDAVEAKYNHETVYGRMDPITTYQGTSRKISMSIVYANNEGEMNKRKAFANFLMRLQYPVYSAYTDSNALAISRPPLVLVQFEDWIKGSKELVFNKEGDTFKPLLCAMSGFAYTPTVGFTPLNSPYVTRAANSKGVTPTRISMKFDFIVLHEQNVGFDERGIWTGGESWGVGDVKNAFAENSLQPKFNQTSISPGEVNSTPNQSNAVNENDLADATNKKIPGKTFNTL